MTRLGIKAYQAIILSARFILFLMSGHLCQILALFLLFVFTGLFVLRSFFADWRETRSQLS